MFKTKNVVHNDNVHLPAKTKNGGKIVVIFNVDPNLSHYNNTGHNNETMQNKSLCQFRWKLLYSSEHPLKRYSSN